MKIGEKESRVKVNTIYGADHAIKVVNASIADYSDLYGKKCELMNQSKFTHQI